MTAASHVTIVSRYITQFRDHTPSPPCRNRSQLGWFFDPPLVCRYCQTLVPPAAVSWARFSSAKRIKVLSCSMLETVPCFMWENELRETRPLYCVLLHSTVQSLTRGGGQRVYLGCSIDISSFFVPPKVTPRWYIAIALYREFYLLCPLRNNFYNLPVNKVTDIKFFSQTKHCSEIVSFRKFSPRRVTSHIV